MGNKSILMSIQPKWVAKILNGEKTIEVRKKFPKDYTGWVYIYCTLPKGKEDYLCYDAFNGFYSLKSKWNKTPIELNGKVVAKFWCDKVEEIFFQIHFNGNALETDYLTMSQLLEKSCLAKTELNEYLGKKVGGVYKFGETYGYAIHITELTILDEPTELKLFHNLKYAKYLEKAGNDTIEHFNQVFEETRIKTAPQSWIYIKG